VTGRPFVIIGAGGHAKVVIATVEAASGRVVRVLDDDPSRRGSLLLGHVVAGPVLEDLIPDDAAVLIAVGANSTRAAIAARLRVAFGIAIHPSAIVHPSVSIGEGSVVFAGSVLQPGVKVGRHVIVNTAASIDHDCSLGDFVHVAPGCRLAGDVHLGEGAFMGVGASAIPGSRVGSWSTIGAGGVVIGTVAANVVAVGAPARVLRPL
jgi:sugar O-acyltransferase (sialic acid O-acetyltransferase NeuD family)